jgi:hypothetical protein
VLVDNRKKERKKLGIYIDCDKLLQSQLILLHNHICLGKINVLLVRYLLSTIHSFCGLIGFEFVIQWSLESPTKAHFQHQGPISLQPN